MAIIPTSRSLSRRAIPTQARSANTVEKILSAATEILTERGLQGLNTNVVAALAGVNVATLYHYFPDKTSILAELFRRDQTRRMAYMNQRLEQLPDVKRLDEWTSELVHAMAQLRRVAPSTSILRQACRTVPELLEIEEADNSLLADHSAQILRKRFPHIAPDRAQLCARVIVESGTALMDRASWDFQNSPGLIDEIILLLTSYFAALEQRP